uniref:Battenin n=1 Tax=Chelonoidis abingdonii TaxID=106734 RepID=A0A8C0GN65_CHEAB
WLLGLCNNFAYVVMLSAAHDILSHQGTPPVTPPSRNSSNTSRYDCNPISTGVSAVGRGPGSGGLGACGGVGRLSLTPLLCVPPGVVLASVSSGLGEISFLALTAFYPRYWGGREGARGWDLTLRFSPQRGGVLLGVGHGGSREGAGSQERAGGPGGVRRAGISPCVSPPSKVVSCWVSGTGGAGRVQGARRELGGRGGCEGLGSHPAFLPPARWCPAGCRARGEPGGCREPGGSWEVWGARGCVRGWDLTLRFSPQ